MGSMGVSLQTDENISKITAIPGTENPAHLVITIYNPLTGTTLVSEIDLTTGDVPNKKALPIHTLPGDQFFNFECLGGRLSFFNTLGTPDEIGGVSSAPENPRQFIYGEQNPQTQVFELKPLDRSPLGAISETTQVLHGSKASDLSIRRLSERGSGEAIGLTC